MPQRNEAIDWSNVGNFNLAYHYFWRISNVCNWAFEMWEQNAQVIIFYEQHKPYEALIYHLPHIFGFYCKIDWVKQNSKRKWSRTQYTIHAYIPFICTRKKRILFANIAHRSYKIIMERNICVCKHKIWPIVCSSLFAFISNILILIKQNLWPQAILLFIWFLFFSFFSPSLIHIHLQNTKMSIDIWDYS